VEILFPTTFPSDWNSALPPHRPGSARDFWAYNVAKCLLSGSYRRRGELRARFFFFLFSWSKLFLSPGRAIRGPFFLGSFSVRWQTQGSIMAYFCELLDGAFLFPDEMLFPSTSHRGTVSRFYGFESRSMNSSDRFFGSRCRPFPFLRFHRHLNAALPPIFHPVT